MIDKIVRCGLEVHAQLNFLKTKLFCSCEAGTHAEPNTKTCPICRGLPGSLPSVNGLAVEFGLRLAKALSMKPVSVLKFSRKHYDYPDLPKGFQITQNLDGILGTEGHIPTDMLDVAIRQIQLEEDPAKLSYSNDAVLVDYNRCGTTLIELVTDPIFTNAEQIKTFLTQYRRLLYYLQISDTRKEGSFRADVNVSVGDHPRVEVKNVGADSDIIEAFLFEVSRQSEITDLSNIGMETRNWDTERKITEVSRDKESNSDYKYMPEGNIPPITIPLNHFNSIKLPTLPWDLEVTFTNKYSLTSEQLDFLLDNLEAQPVFELSAQMQNISSPIINRFFWQEYLTWFKIKDTELSPKQNERLFNFNFDNLKDLLQKLESDKISNQDFKKIFKKYVLYGSSLADVEELNSSEEFTNNVILYLQQTYPQHFTEIPLKPKKVNYLVGLGIKYSKGKVNPKSLQKQLLNLS